MLLTLIPVGFLHAAPTTDLHHILQAYTLIINKVRYVGSGYVSISANDGSAFWPRQPTHNMQNTSRVFLRCFLKRKVFLRGQKNMRMWKKDEKVRKK